MIIDLDADIKADTMMTSREKMESSPSSSPAHSPQPRLTNGSSLSGPAYDSADCDKSLKMKIKRTKSGRQEIVKPEGGDQLASNGSSDSDNSSSPSPSPSPPPPPQAVSHSQMNGGAKSPGSNNSSSATLHQINSKRLKVRLILSVVLSPINPGSNHLWSEYHIWLDGSGPGWSVSGRRETERIDKLLIFISNG